MSIRTRLAPGLAVTAAGLALAACTTGGTLPPTQVLRYHLGEPIDRGTVSVQPLTTGDAPASIEYKTYAAAVETQLLRNGYALPAAGAQPQLIATVSYTRTSRLAPPRRSPVSVGLGGGGFSGGGYRGGGVGLGGGVSFPIGGGRAREVVETELAVTIKRRADQSPVWEGRAHAYADSRRPIDAAPDADATKLAAALFTGFPGQSGRTIDVK